VPDADAYAVAIESGPAAVPALPAGDEAEPDTGQYRQAAEAAAQTPVFRMPGPGNIPRQRAVDHFQPEKEWHLQKPGGMRETAATTHPNGGPVTKRRRGRAGPKLMASRRFRDGNPDFRHRESLRMQARYEAFMALARKHPAEYTALYEAELKHLGIGAPPMERPCACGGMIHRKAPVGAWPKKCEGCRT